MCGRYTLVHSEDEIRETFHLKTSLDVHPNFNIPPSSDVLAIKHPGEACRLRWGLIPVWAEESDLGHKLINARAETIDKKMTFKNSFKNKRCLIITSGFYEWKREGHRKTPYFIFMKNKKPFAFAGIWSTWLSPTEKTIESCAIITTAPNMLLSQIHKRMPAIIRPEDYDKWLDPARKQLKPFLKPYDANEMKAYAVSPYVNKPANNDHKCIEPAKRA